MAASGADVLELDHRVDIGRACDILGPEITVWGNLDPVGLLARRGPQEVERATRDLIESCTLAGHRRFVISSGCTLAMETPAENLHALITAVR
jgi:uroporphyrinogen-III decarboxylase